MSWPGILISPRGPCLTRLTLPAARHIGEESGELPELSARPLIEGVVVALGALQF